MMVFRPGIGVKKGLSSGTRRKAEDLERRLVRPGRRNMKFRLLAQDHDSAAVGFRVVDPGGAVPEEPLEGVEVDCDRVVLEEPAEEIEPRALGLVPLEGQGLALQHLRESWVEIIVGQRMVRVVAELGSLERDEFGHLAGRALEYGDFIRPSDDIGLWRRGLDVL